MNFVVKCTRRAIPFILLLWAGPCIAHGADFFGLGDLPGGSRTSRALDASADGSVIVGWSVSHPGSSFGAWEAFRWTRETGMVGLGDLPGRGPGSLANGVSPDGMVIVGTGGTSNRFEAFKYSERMEGLGALAPPAGLPPYSWAQAVSNGGTVAVGSSSGPRGQVATRFTANGPEAISLLVGEGMDVSADGQFIAGWGQHPHTLAPNAFRWTREGGLEFLTDAAGNVQNAQTAAMSADGTTIVGTALFADGRSPFLWNDTRKLISLGRLPGASGDGINWAYGVSGDGSVVVGHFQSAGPFIWTEAGGMRSLQSAFIEEFGLSSQLAGWTLREALAVSADGRVIVGSGDNPVGEWEAWVAIVPEPQGWLLASFAFVGLAGLLAFERAKHRRARDPA